MSPSTTPTRRSPARGSSAEQSARVPRTSRTSADVSAFCRIPPARRSRSSSRSQCRSSANQPATEALGSRGGARLEAQNARLPV